MADIWVRAQWSVTGSLMGDGKILLSEGFTLYSEDGKMEQRVASQHEVHGTCDPEELAVVIHDAIAGHL